MTYPKALRTLLRLLGPHAILYKALGLLEALGLGFRVKGLDSPMNLCTAATFPYRIVLPLSVAGPYTKLP